MNNVTAVGNIAALDQTGQTTQKLMTFLRIDELLEWMSDAYGYDISSLKANTEKDKIRKENLDKINKLKEVLTINSTENAQPMGTPNAQPGTTATPPAIPNPTASSTASAGANPTLG